MAVRLGRKRGQSLLRRAVTATATGHGWALVGLSVWNALAFSLVVDAASVVSTGLG